MATEQMKRCSKCGAVKPLGDFYAQRRGLQGRRPECKRCQNGYHNQWARARYAPKTGRRYLTRGDLQRGLNAGLIPRREESEDAG